MKFCKKHVISACFFLFLPIAMYGEVPVVDDSDNFAMVDEQQGDYSAADADDNADEEEQPLARDDRGQVSASSSNDSAKLLDKIQKMQQEIQDLRGQLEMQAHDLKLVQKQQLTFYKDIDRRIGNEVPKSDLKKPLVKDAPALELSTTPAPVKSEPLSIPKPVAATSRINPADEQISYLAAYDLVKDKRFDEAISAMQAFVDRYPQGGYTANAQYWLGELYMVKNDYPKAIEHFEVVVHRFSSSSKSAPSLLKIGYALAATGKTPQARQRLQEVMKNYPDTPTAQLAASKLESLNNL